MPTQMAQNLAARSGTGYLTVSEKGPSLFPCASRVKIPQVGADETDLTPEKTITLERPTVRSSLRVTPGVSNTYVKKISSGLAFSEDVVRDRCFHTLPYDSKYFLEVLDVSHLIPTPPKTKHPTGRHNARGADNKHLPCHIQKRATHKLKPIKRKILEKAVAMHQQEIDKKIAELQKQSEAEQSKHAIFLTETLAESERGQSPIPEWDEYLMSILSETTARWISNKKVPAGAQQEKLTTMLNTYYGPTEENKIELVRDNASEGDLSHRTNVSSIKSHRWKKDDETLLDRVRDLQKALGKPTDPYADDNAAAFYRLPAGFRRAKRNQDREEAGACNTTAYNIEVQRYVPPPPLALQDLVPEGIGENTLYKTDNLYQQEWLSGIHQMHPIHEDPAKIVMENNNKYHKQLQQETPRNPAHWFPHTDDEKQKQLEDRHKVKVFEKGMHRWKALPQPIDRRESTMWEDAAMGNGYNDTAEKLHLLLPGADTMLAVSPDPNMRKQARENSTLVQIITDWRNKWNLDMRYADANPDDLIRDMADIHVHIRLKAVTTCARAAEYRPPPEPGIQLEPEKDKSQIKLLPEKLFLALECCLDDNHEQVSRAAAIALYTLERPTEKAEEILRNTLRDAKSVDRWTAAQCLAYYGECDSEVVGELVYQLLHTEDNIRHERAAFLLAKLSENSTLVHSMLGEQLNSSSWRHRVMAAKIMPKLFGNINKDLVHKLTHLMWQDWHTEVRKAAAQTLGKTGHGKDVHDELREKIISGNERQRVEAVSKIGHLGIMTAKLLPVFLDCFADHYVSVRMEACLSCNNLRIKDPAVLKKLVFLATYDPIWKVKALALQALSIIGEVTSEIRDCVLWALRYEDQAGVRAEACHTAVKLGLRDNKVAQILQDRLLVETSDVVKDEITQALETLGISPTEDMAMVAQIKTEVRKLCTRNNICAHITINEQEEAKDANIERMIYKSPEEKKKEQEKPYVSSLRKHLLRSRAQSQRVSFTPEAVSGEATLPHTPAQEPFDSSDCMSFSISVPGSRPGTGYTTATDRPDTAQTSESTSEDSETDALSVITSRTKSPMNRIAEEDEDGNPGGRGSKGKVWSDMQTYVEIGGTGEQGDDVLNVKHESPSSEHITEP